MADCPSYDPISEYGGPCWTCRGEEGRCPAMACPETTHGTIRCQLDAPHPARMHHHERPDGDGRIGTHVFIWSTPDLDVQPDYPLGAVEMGPWIVQSKDFIG